MKSGVSVVVVVSAAVAVSGRHRVYFLLERTKGRECTLFSSSLSNVFICK